MDELRPICCVLPPHILRNIAQNAKTTKQRQSALQTLASDSTLRSIRATRAAVSGATAQRRAVPTAPPGPRKQRHIYTADGSETLPGKLLSSEGQETDGPDSAVNEAYRGLGATFDFYWEVFERNSIDDEGLPLNATVHYGKAYDNAFWDGQRMVFGDGDGELFNRFTIAVDVIGHELTHGVVEDEGPLAYFYESGALNESMADVFGIMIKQKLLNQTADKADWLIGAGLFTKDVKGVALRSMKEPGTAYDDPVLGRDPQPANMKDIVRTNQDSGGVHLNSGIPNRAFYLAATALGGKAWERAGLIWYTSLRDSRLRSNATFRSFASISVANATRLFGTGSEPEKAVRNAWSEVGLKLAQ